MDTNNHYSAAELHQATVARAYWPRFIPKFTGELDFHPGVDGVNFKIRKVQDDPGLSARPVLLD